MNRTTSSKIPLVNTILTISISLVWLINGLFCKLLNFVPRHQEIVGRILGQEYDTIATKTIGVLEILMFLWIVTRIKSRWCAMVQMFVIAMMNIMELIVVPDLLLFGKWNSLIALFFIVVIFFNEFVFNKKLRVSKTP
ncbi:MAG: DoxX-like family protein [Bacteroidota bacterium]|nr:DoxX-like family protein [Bacteroidota bacterium]